MLTSNRHRIRHPCWLECKARKRCTTRARKSFHQPHSVIIARVKLETYERETQTDQTPDDDQQAGRPGRLLVAEQGLDMVQIELLGLSAPGHLLLDLVLGRSGGDVSDKEGFTLLQVFQSQVAGLAVLLGNRMDDPDGLFVSTLAHQILGGFLQVEAEESQDEHDHAETSHHEELQE